MAKYHISKSGPPAICKASVSACPLGGEDAHGEFNSKQEAQAWAEESLAKEYDMFDSVKKSAPAFESRFDYLNKSQYNDIH